MSGTLGVSGIATISNTTESTGTTDGSLIIAGGVGIAKKVYIGGTLNVNTDIATTNDLTMTIKDNSATSLKIGDGTTHVITVDTTNAAEKVIFKSMLSYPYIFFTFS